MYRLQFNMRERAIMSGRQGEKVKEIVRGRGKGVIGFCLAENKWKKHRACCRRKSCFGCYANK